LKESFHVALGKIKNYFLCRNSIPFKIFLGHIKIKEKLKNKKKPQNKKAMFIK